MQYMWSRTGKKKKIIGKILPEKILKIANPKEIG